MGPVLMEHAFQKEDTGNKEVNRTDVCVTKEITVYTEIFQPSFQTVSTNNKNK